MQTHCWECGKETEYSVPQISNPFKSIKLHEKQKIYDKCEFPFTRSYCDLCKKARESDLRHKKHEYVKLKTFFMIESAVSNLENQMLEIYEYKDAIAAVSEFALEKPNKFQSSYEIIAAIILIHNRINIKMQYKVGNKQVDILIPDLHCVLEIDGDRHDHKQEYDAERDIEIIKELGAKWEIIHIPIKYLDKKAELLIEAIKQMYCDRKKERSKNNGILPLGYSKKNDILLNKYLGKQYIEKRVSK